MKAINKEKLAAMGYERVKRVCHFHLTRAVQAGRQQDRQTYNLHCDLLDQCGTIAKTLANGKPTVIPQGYARKRLELSFVEKLRIPPLARTAWNKE